MEPERTAKINDRSLILWHGDLTTMGVDAIVNAANNHLAHGGGVAGAIVRRGGATIQTESDAWVREHGPVPTGEVAITGAGALQARAVIHAVGPRMGEGDEDAKLAAATLHSLELASDRGFRSIAFPAISTGIFGYPLERCARIMIEVAASYLETDPGSVREVWFALYGARALEAFVRELDRQRADQSAEV